MGESLSTKIETIEVCHALIQNPNFLRLLLQIDADLAAQMHAGGCSCGGVLHRANYPRKLGLAVVLTPQRRTTLSAAAVQVIEALAIPERTIARWRHWWLQLFCLTPLWQAACARFMPPLQTLSLPTSLIERFTGPAAEAALHLLAFLRPLSVQS